MKNFSKKRRLAGRGGFVLFEAMIATAIFAISVIGLARCVEAGLNAGMVQREDSRARRALINCMHEVEVGRRSLSKLSDNLSGEFAGMRLDQSVVALELEDQNKQKVEGIVEVNLEVTWVAGGGRGSKRLKFYVPGGY
jgi:Tfp pilus assembly protein PilV